MERSYRVAGWRVTVRAGTLYAVFPIARLAAVMGKCDKHEFVIGEVVEHSIRESRNGLGMYYRLSIPARKHWRDSGPFKDQLYSLFDKFKEIIAEAGLLVVVPINCCFEF